MFVTRAGELVSTGLSNSNLLNTIALFIYWTIACVDHALGNLVTLNRWWSDCVIIHIWNIFIFIFSVHSCFMETI